MELEKYIQELKAKGDGTEKGVLLIEECPIVGGTREIPLFFKSISALEDYLIRATGADLSEHSRARIREFWKGGAVTILDGRLRFKLRPLSVPELY